MTKPNIAIVVVCGLLGAAILIQGCTTDRGTKAEHEAAPATPVVNDSRTDLLLSWFEDDKPQTAPSTTEVPEQAKKEVRVQDPTIAPEKRNPAWVFVADLTKKNDDGNYTVKAVPRADYEAKRHKKVEHAPARNLANKDAKQVAPGTVIMYATHYCPVCQKARRWLLDQKIPYIEKDLDEDPKAATELHQKGKAQGVSTSGVPVFEIKGKLIPGFDPAAIKKAL